MGLFGVGDDEEVGRDALPIAVALSDNDILEVSGTRGDRGPGTRPRSIVGSVGGAKEDTGGTTISAGGGARLLLGAAVGASDWGCSDCMVVGILGLAFGVCDDCEVLLGPREGSGAGNSARR